MNLPLGRGPPSRLPGWSAARPLTLRYGPRVGPYSGRAVRPLRGPAQGDIAIFAAKNPAVRSGNGQTGFRDGASFGPMPGMQKSDPELLPVHRPRCPNCQARMITAGVLPRPDGFEHRTYECPKCAHAETRIEASDQFEFDALSASDRGPSPRPNVAPGSIPDNQRTSQPQPKH
jgi:hypothetical protein